jgi:hypothetical protein
MFLLHPDGMPPLSPLEQLVYVIPASHHALFVPKPLVEHLRRSMSHCFPEEWATESAFCQYSWEAHPMLPDIPLEELHRNLTPGAFFANVAHPDRHAAGGGRKSRQGRQGHARKDT